MKALPVGPREVHDPTIATTMSAAAASQTSLFMGKRPREVNHKRRQLAKGGPTSSQGVSHSQREKGGAVRGRSGLLLERDRERIGGIASGVSSHRRGDVRPRCQRSERNVHKCAIALP